MSYAISGKYTFPLYKVWIKLWLFIHTCATVTTSPATITCTSSWRCTFSTMITWIRTHSCWERRYKKILELITSKDHYFWVLFLVIFIKCNTVANIHTSLIPLSMRLFISSILLNWDIYILLNLYSQTIVTLRYSLA